jgi:hypothetical protein
VLSTAGGSTLQETCLQALLLLLLLLLLLRGVHCCCCCCYWGLCVRCAVAVVRCQLQVEGQLQHLQAPRRASWLVGWCILQCSVLGFSRLKAYANHAGVGDYLGEHWHWHTTKYRQQHTCGTRRYGPWGDRA